ncbi:MAG: hypothetical protein WBM07_11070 [Chitinivibrionales bacterium]
MKDYKALILIIGIILFLINCSFLNGPDDSLTLSKRPYTGNELRTDGFYYQLDPDGNLNVFFLFRNGILLYGGSIPENDLPQQEESYSNGSYYQSASQYKICWGVFQIDSNRIQYESWNPSSGGPLPAYKSSGNILNDTTFEITNSERVNGTEQTSGDWIYYFKQFSPKPDSVTQFIP